MKTTTPPPKGPAPSQGAGKKAAGKAAPSSKGGPKGPPSGKPAKGGAASKPAPTRSAGKGAAPASAAASKKSGTKGSSATAASDKPAVKQAPGRASKLAPGAAKPAAPSRSASPSRSEPAAKAAPASKPAGPLTKVAPTKGGPAPSRATMGGRPLPARPRLPKSDLAGDEPIVLVPARTSEAAGPKGATAPASRSGGRAGGERVVLSSAARAAATVATPVLPLPVRKQDEPMTLEERAEAIERRLAAQSDEFRQRYWDTFYMSWIYHDSALEGVVYTVDELRAALGSANDGRRGGGPASTGATAAPAATPAPGSSPTAATTGNGSIIPPAPSSSPGEDGALETNIQPACEEIRRHREAIDYVRDYAKKKGPITVDVIRKIFLILHPEEGDLKSVKYRRDIPQHRLYFHEYEQPDKIAHKVRQVVDWLNDPETKKGRNGLRIAARAHYDLLRVFPFQSDSGKVSRLFMNLLLLRSGLPPSIILSAERQRYYDALKGSANQILTMVQESVEVAVQSIERLLDEHDAKSRTALP